MEGGGEPPPPSATHSAAGQERGRGRGRGRSAASPFIIKFKVHKQKVQPSAGVTSDTADIEAQAEAQHARASSVAPPFTSSTTSTSTSASTSTTPAVVLGSPPLPTAPKSFMGKASFKVAKRKGQPMQIPTQPPQPSSPPPHPPPPTTTTLTSSSTAPPVSSSPLRRRAPSKPSKRGGSAAAKGRPPAPSSPMGSAPPLPFVPAPRSPVASTSFPFSSSASYAASLGLPSSSTIPTPRATTATATTTTAATAASTARMPSPSSSSSSSFSSSPLTALSPVDTFSSHSPSSSSSSPSSSSSASSRRTSASSFLRSSFDSAAILSPPSSSSSSSSPSPSSSTTAAGHHLHSRGRSLSDDRDLGHAVQAQQSTASSRQTVVTMMHGSSAHPIGGGLKHRRSPPTGDERKTKRKRKRKAKDTSDGKAKNEGERRRPDGSNEDEDDGGRRSDKVGPRGRKASSERRGRDAKGEDENFGWDEAENPPKKQRKKFQHVADDGREVDDDDEENDDEDEDEEESDKIGVWDSQSHLSVETTALVLMSAYERYVFPFTPMHPLVMHEDSVRLCVGEPADSASPLTINVNMALALACNAIGDLQRAHEFYNRARQKVAPFFDTSDYTVAEALATMAYFAFGQGDMARVSYYVDLAASICREVGAYNSDTYAKCMVGVALDPMRSLKEKERAVVEYRQMAVSYPYFERDRLHILAAAPSCLGGVKGPAKVQCLMLTRLAGRCLAECTVMLAEFDNCKSAMAGEGSEELKRWEREVERLKWLQGEESRYPVPPFVEACRHDVFLSSMRKLEETLDKPELMGKSFGETAMAYHMVLRAKYALLLSKERESFDWALRFVAVLQAINVRLMSPGNIPVFQIMLDILLKLQRPDLVKLCLDIADPWVQMYPFAQGIAGAYAKLALDMEAALASRRSFSSELSLAPSFAGGGPQATRGHDRHAARLHDMRSLQIEEERRRQELLELEASSSTYSSSSSSSSDVPLELSINNGYVSGSMSMHDSSLLGVSVSASAASVGGVPMPPMPMHMSAVTPTALENEAERWLMQAEQDSTAYAMRGPPLVEAAHHHQRQPLGQRPEEFTQPPPMMMRVDVGPGMDGAPAQFDSVTGYAWTPAAAAATNSAAPPEAYPFGPTDPTWGAGAHHQ